LHVRSAYGWSRWKYNRNFLQYSYLFSHKSNTNFCAIQTITTWRMCCLHQHVLSCLPFDPLQHIKVLWPFPTEIKEYEQMCNGENLLCLHMKTKFLKQLSGPLWGLRSAAKAAEGISSYPKVHCQKGISLHNLSVLHLLDTCSTCWTPVLWCLTYSSRGAPLRLGSTFLIS